MKTLMHPDYWVEIPAGEFLTGVSQEQRKIISTHIRHQVGYAQFPVQQCNLVENILEKIRLFLGQTNVTTQPIFVAAGLNDDEKAIARTNPYSTVIDLEIELMTAPVQEAIWVDRFYIAQFPITKYQYLALVQDHKMPSLPSPWQGKERERRPNILQMEDIRRVCQQLNARLPTGIEWDKAARGIDGRLYPWGDEWIQDAGYFYRGQSLPNFAVDTFPNGVSPYGVWGMAGGLPEVVTVPGTQHFTILPYNSRELRGCHPKESSETWAWYDHMLIWEGTGHWMGFRPVLDKWPVQQWQGVDTQEEKADEATTPETKPLLNPFEWLVLKMQSATELEPMIEAVEAKHNLKAQMLLKKFLQNDSANEQAWLLMVLVLDDSTRQQDCIQQALTINPESEIGLKLQDRLADNLL